MTRRPVPVEGRQPSAAAPKRPADTDERKRPRPWLRGAADMLRGKGAETR